MSNEKAREGEKEGETKGERGEGKEERESESGEERRKRRHKIRPGEAGSCPCERFSGCAPAPCAQKAWQG